MTLLDPVLRTDSDLARLHVPEQKHLLRREGDDEHGDIVLEDLASGYLSPQSNIVR